MFLCKVGRHQWEYARDKYNRIIRNCLRCPAKQCQVQGRESMLWIRCEKRKD